MNHRLLLVTPTFHGYWRNIGAAFEQLGYEVTVHRYDAHDSLVSRTRHHLTAELPRRLGRSTETFQRRLLTTAAIQAARRAHPDVTLVVKGDLLDPDFHDALGTGPRVLWLYDELRRTHHTAESVGAYDGVASYSHLDVATLKAARDNVSYVPLAFDPADTPTPRPGPDCVFVGARYPKRATLLTSLWQAGIPVRAYGRDWSVHVADRLRTWSWPRPDLPAGRDLPRPEAYAVMAGAPATINIHGDQDGFTMRTFEAAGVGGVQFVDRDDVSDLYEPGTEIATFSSVDALVDLCQRAIADRAWGDRLRAAGRARTLAQHTLRHRAKELERLWHSNTP